MTIKFRDLFQFSLTCENPVQTAEEKVFDHKWLHNK